jgi:hypothetical protein
LLVGGLALAHFRHRKGWTIAACVLGACIFMFGGPVSSRLNHVGIIIAYSLFPLCLLLLHNMIERPSLRGAISFGFALALLVLGRAQVPFMMVVILLVYFIHEYSSSDERKSYKCLSMGIALIVTELVTAIPMALTLQFADMSNRPQSDLETALRSSMNPINFLTLMSPSIFRSLNIGSDWGTGYGNMPETDSTDKAFNYLFCGTLSFLILIWHFASRDLIVRRDNRFFFVMLLLFTLYAMGRYTPVYETLYHFAPGVSKFRRPVDASFIIILMLAYIILS